MERGEGAAADPMLGLPRELWAEILYRLSGSELVRVARLVCKDWYVHVKPFLLLHKIL